MHSYDSVVALFGELWLKGRNRGTFVRKLVSNVELALDGTGAAVEHRRDRLMITAKPMAVPDVLERLGHVFGISWYAPVAKADSDISAIMKTSTGLVPKGTAVRLVAHRSDKSTPFTSQELVHAFLEHADALTFKLDKDAKETLYIEVTHDGALMHTQHIKGLGGLPVGSSGKAIVLMSGGIDSPVAAYYAMKRGLMPIYLHFHAFGSSSEVEGTKIQELLAILAQYTGKSKAYYAPAHIFQSIAMKLPHSLELVLFKRFMLETAEAIAAKEHAIAIVTGESLGQVASQTVRNLAASEQGTRLFIMRPLIGMDKLEIISAAKALGTFEPSIKPYRDVCSIRSRDPATAASAARVGELYAGSGLSAAVPETLAKTFAATVQRKAQE